MRAAWWFAIGYFATWLTFGLVRWRLYRGMERLTRQEIYLADRRRGQAALAYAVLRRVFLALEALSACAIDRIARNGSFLWIAVDVNGNWEAAVHAFALVVGTGWLLEALLGYALRFQGVGWCPGRYVELAPRSLASRAQLACAAVLAIVPAILLVQELHG